VVSDPHDLLAAADQELQAADDLLEHARRHRGPDRQKRAHKSYAPRTACPHCAGLDSRVIDPRPLIGLGEGRTYWRARECQHCGTIYSTEEIPRAIIAVPVKSA